MRLQGSEILPLMFLVLTLLPASSYCQETCEFDLDAFTEGHFHPLLVQESTMKIVYPEARGEARMVKLTQGTKYLVTCPGRSNALVKTKSKVADLICSSGELRLTGQSNSRKIQWIELDCLRKPQPTLRLAQKIQCGEGGVMYTLGWSLAKIVLPQIHVCFNPTTETTKFTWHAVQGKHIAAKSVDAGRPSFKSAEMFSADVSSLYSKKNQERLADEVLGSRKILTVDGQQFLAKGHLAPDADFVYTFEQDATYYYANVVPQWQGINNGNWKRLENDIRDLAKKKKRTLEVWTGTYGTLQLPDANNNHIDLFLGLPEKLKIIPVPALVWKVVHDIKSRQAVAIVGVNELTGKGKAKELSLFQPPCRDLCHELSWIDWDTSDRERGLAFCCQVKDLKPTIPVLPNLGSVTLLK